MLRKLLIGIVMAMFAIAAQAQKPAAGINEGADLLPKTRADFMRMADKASGPTEEEVGDVDSFGREKTYLGVVQTNPVNIDVDCSWAGPDDICIVGAAAPGTTFVDESDVGSLQLPGKASNSILCFTFTQFSTWVWGNSTASTQTGSMGLFFTVQVENDVLDGLNDSDGNPFGGFLFNDEFGNSAPTGIVVAMSQNTLPVGASEIQRERFTRSCTGGIVSANSLRARGLTDKQIKDFFKEPMTISFGVAGSTRMVDFATFFGGIRLYGD